MLKSFAQSALLNKYVIFSSAHTFFFPERVYIFDMCSLSLYVWMCACVCVRTQTYRQCVCTATSVARRRVKFTEFTKLVCIFGYAITSSIGKWVRGMQAIDFRNYIRNELVQTDTKKHLKELYDGKKVLRKFNWFLFLD